MLSSGNRLEKMIVWGPYKTKSIVETVMVFDKYYFY